MRQHRRHGVVAGPASVQDLTKRLGTEVEHRADRVHRQVIRRRLPLISGEAGTAS
jgi:hypothetical protein